MRSFISTALAGLLAVIALGHRAQAFTVQLCVTHLTHDVDAKFRLPAGKAQARCTVIAGRIARLSHLIVGKWAKRGPHGLETMVFGPDGVVEVHEFNFGNRSMKDTVQKWSFENPYGTVGAESLVINDGPSTKADVRGRVMTLTSQPANAEIVEQWRRVGK